MKYGNGTKGKAKKSVRKEAKAMKQNNKSYKKGGLYGKPEYKAQNKSIKSWKKDKMKSIRKK